MKNNEIEAKRLFSAAEKFRKKNLFAKAIKKYSESLHFVENVECYLCVGDCYRRMGLFSQAQENYQISLRLLKNKKNTSLYAEVLVDFALCFRAIGKYKKAVILLEQAGQMFKGNSDSLGIAYTLWAKGGVLRFSSDFKGAKKSFLRAEKIFIRERHHEGEAYALCGLGGIMRMMGDFNQSLKYYKKANRIFTRIKDDFGLGYSYCGIGNAYRMKGENSNAHQYFGWAKKTYKKFGDQISYAYTLWSEGTLYKIEGKLKNALICFNASANIFKKTNDKRGEIYSRLGRIELGLLGKKKIESLKLLKDILKHTRQYGLKIEACHTKLMIEYLGKKSMISGELRREYLKLGQKINFTYIPPYNIP